MGAVTLRRQRQAAQVRASLPRLRQAPCQRMYQSSLFPETCFTRRFESICRATPRDCCGASTESLRINRPHFP